MKQILYIFLLLIISILSAAAQPDDTLTVNDCKVNFGHRKTKNRQVDAIIIHSSYYNWDGAPYLLENILSVYRIYGVSAHYIIDRKGNVFSLVDEQNVAFHAGAGIFPDGATRGGNERSLGIELMTSIYSNPTEIQMESLVKLIANIEQRYKIKYVLRHSDIAPERKTDPWNFDWTTFLDKLKHTNRQIVLKLRR